ncbi:MAG: nuclear transport factor 2 family protein, partial [Myxococcota bacterium]
MAPEAEPAAEGDRDREAIDALITSFFDNVDRRQFAAAEAQLTDQVAVDYSALGGPNTTMARSELVGGWKGFLPGFDRTVHHTHNAAVWIAGQRATATFDAIASHFIAGAEGGDLWTVFVGYDTEFVKDGDTWRLAKIDLELYRQVGNLELPKLAGPRAANAKPLATADPAVTEAVEAFFSALEGRDIEALLATFADDAVQLMPLAPEAFPSRVAGVAALRKQFTPVMDYQQSYEREIIGTGNDRIALVSFRGTVTTSEGKPYNNAYVNLFEIDERGRIARIVEYFNPKILLTGWPGLSLPHHSVHEAGAAVSSGVNKRDIEFTSGGDTLRGHLFLPRNFDPANSYRAAVVTGSWTSVKEQMPDTYASRLADQGFVAMTFDFRGFGTSEGAPRQVEDPTKKIEDIEAAVAFLAKQPGVDRDSLAGLGVCASAGYMAHAATRSAALKKVVLVAPWLHDEAMAAAIYDQRPGGSQGLLASAELARKAFEADGTVEYVLAASELDPLSAMYVPGDAFDYYLSPASGAGPHYDNRFAV